MKASLPIGTVVLLKNGTHKVMVIGYYPKVENDKFYDYVGTTWPEGLETFERILVFNHDDIIQVFNQAYVDEEQKTYMINLDGAIKAMVNNQSNPSIEPNN